MNVKNENLNDIQVKIIDGKKYYVIEELLAKEIITSYLNESHYKSIIEEKDKIITTNETHIIDLQRRISTIDTIYQNQIKALKLQRNILIVTNIITGAGLAISIAVNVKLF